MTKVDSITSAHDWNPFTNEWSYHTEIAFKNSPWEANTGGTDVAYSKVRRMTLMNAPEFLKTTGEMVFNPATRRIYFLCPSEGAHIGGVTAPDINVESNKFMEIAWPRVSNNAGVNWSAPIVVGPDSGYIDRQVIIRDLVFGTGRGTAIQLQRMRGTAESEIQISGCRFRNQGHVGVSLTRCKGVRITGCSFEDGLRGHLKIDADRNFTQPYVIATSPPISDVMDLTSDGIVVTNSGFFNGGLMWPYNGTVEMANWNIGTQITNNTFHNLSGIAVRIHGAKNLISQNTLQDCVKDITDYGAIYCGRSLVQIGNIIDDNHIQGIKWRGRTTQTMTPNSLEDDVCGVYLDDYICGTTVSWNSFSDCQTAIMSNGGRFNLMRKNGFDAAVDHPLRTNVARGKLLDPLGDPDANSRIGTFRYWYDPQYYRRSVANQLYSELRNLYQAIKVTFPTAVFPTAAWNAVQNTGAYASTYQPISEPDRKDLQHLVAKLNTGQPSWWIPDNASPTYVDLGKNSLRRIQMNGGPGDWFLFATSSVLSGVPDRKWLVNYPNANPDDSVTILKNYGNVWVWCDENFADLSKRPVTASHIYFRSYRPHQPSTKAFMDDEVGYFSFEEPNYGNE